MFTLQELEDDPTAILDIKEDIREECEKLGEITNVVLYDEEPDGIVSVRFKDPTAAKACVSVSKNNRFVFAMLTYQVMNGGTPSDYPHEFTVREFIPLIARSSNSCGRMEKIQPTRKGKSIGSHPLNFQIRDATRLAKSSASSLSSPYRIKRTRNGIIHLTVSPELQHTRFYI